MSWLKLIKPREKTFFVLSRAWDEEKKFWVPMGNRTSNLRIPRSDSLSYFCSQTWLYRQYAGRVSYELRNKPHSPQILCGSVVEHRSAESEGLRFHSSWGLKTIFHCPTLMRRCKTSFSISLSSSKLTISLVLLIKLVGKLLLVIIRYTYTSLLVVYLPYIKAS